MFAFKTVPGFDFNFLLSTEILDFLIPYMTYFKKQEFFPFCNTKTDSDKKNRSKL